MAYLKKKLLLLSAKRKACLGCSLGLTKEVALHFPLCLIQRLGLQARMKEVLKQIRHDS